MTKETRIYEEKNLLSKRWWKKCTASCKRMKLEHLLGFLGGSVVKTALWMQVTAVWPLVQKDPTCHRAVKPAPQLWSLCPRAHESQFWAHSCNYWSPLPRALAPQQEKPPQAACSLQWTVAPLAKVRESPCGTEEPPQPKVKLNK